ncbi:MAG: DUF1003 domain-containing protein [Byssovorax sp.]
MAPRTRKDDLDLAGHVHQNVENIGTLVSTAERKITRHQRAVERFTRAIGRPRTLYLVIGGVIGWALLNLVGPRFGVHRVDQPPFFWLQGVISLGALLTTVMVLTTQNRHLHLAEQRAHLDLQVNLLAEQKVAKLIGLIEELRRDLPNVVNRRDSVAEKMQEPVDPAAVASAIEATLSQAKEAESEEDWEDDEIGSGGEGGS